MRDERVRTFHARRGRRSALTQARLDTLVPRYVVPPEVLTSAGAVGRPGRVVLEIGCGHGAAALGYAAAHPDAHVVAVDVHPPGVARMLAAAEEAALAGRISVVLGDAVELLERRIPDRALDAIHLFFPDPWPKARHRRRRFVSGHTLDLFAALLAPGGQILLATDSGDYAAYVRETVVAHGAFIAVGAQRPSWRPVAGFEAKALAAGREITELRLERATRIELA